MNLTNRVLFWAPRVISMLFIAFVSMFALDVFQESLGFWRTIAALAIHLIPSFALAAALIVSWRWEWVGALLFTAFAIFFAVIVRSNIAGKAMFVIPCVITAGLFLMNWLKRTELHAR